MQDNGGETKMNSKVTFFCGPLHMDVSVLADPKELISNGCDRTLDMGWKTCRKR